MNKEESIKPAGYEYDLIHVIRENLMWKLNLTLLQAQEIAENIAEQVVYGRWIIVQGKEYQRQFDSGFTIGKKV